MKKIIFFLLVIFEMIYMPISISAMDLDEYDFSELNEFLKEQDEFQDISFEKLVSDIMQNGFATFPRNFFEYLRKIGMSEIDFNKRNIEILIVILVFSALFSNMSASMDNSVVAKTGSFFSRFLIGILLMQNYETIQKIIETFFGKLLDFIHCILPVYVFSVTFSTGKVSAIALNQSTIVVITILNYVIRYLMVPCIKIFVLIGFVNMISADDSMKKMKDLIKSLIIWGNNTILAFVTGLNVVKAMVAPYADKQANFIVQKTVSLIPGIGNGASSAYELVLGTGKYIRNSIGVAGIIIILIFCAIPVIKMVIFAIIYRFCGALLEPISEKTIINGISDLSEGIIMSLQLLLTGAFMFMITIGIVCI